SMLERVVDPPRPVVTGTGTGDGNQPPRIVTGTGSGKPRRSGLWWVAALLGLAAIGVTLYVFAKRVTIPDLKGMTRESASKLLESAGLEPLEGEGIDPAVPLGHVMSQYPERGVRVWRGAAVTMVVAT